MSEINKKGGKNKYKKIKRRFICNYLKSSVVLRKQNYMRILNGGASG